MSEITRHVGNQLARRESRGLHRDLARMEGQAKTELARIELETDVYVGRVRGLTYIGAQAQDATAFLTEREAHHGQMVPEARDRLQFLTDGLVAGLGQLINDATQTLRH
jgi:hypothetical protein